MGQLTCAHSALTTPEFFNVNYLNYLAIYLVTRLTLQQSDTGSMAIKQNTHPENTA